jgi:hypothetical protein
LSLRFANLWRKEKGSLSVNLAMLVGLVAAGYWWLYPIMWLLPLATWYQLVSGIRDIAEHAASFPTTMTLCATPGRPTPIPWSGFYWLLIG